jgi:hypothetical protein
MLSRRHQTLQHLFIVNPAGGLIYYLCWSGTSPLPGNDALRLASTFHSLHAISSELAPQPGSGGISEIEVATFSLRCLHSPTGLKIFATWTPGTTNMDNYLAAVYDLYSDYVLKDPFYEVDMPIRVEKFEQKLRTLTTEIYGTATLST